MYTLLNVLSWAGDMDAILDNIMCCTADDEERFANIILAAIKAKTVPARGTFTGESDVCGPDTIFASHCV